jgi:hypothetical protein
MSEHEAHAYQGFAAIYAGATAIAAAIGASYGYTLPAVIGGGILMCAGVMLIATAITAKKGKQ